MNEIIIAAIAAALIAAPIAASSAWWRRRTRSTLALLIGVLAVEVVWLANLAVIAADFRDADGFVDCWPRCTTFQEAVGITLWVGPIVAALAAIAAVAAILSDRVGSAGASVRSS